MGKKRAMTRENASLKKIGGHLAEHDFADLIGGVVNRGNPQDKKDVIDSKHRTHSVKKGRYWQIFLYRRSRLETNTILKGIGNISKIFIKCIDAFPDARSDYLEDKDQYKTKLQDPMKALCAELQKQDIRRAFYEKAIFNGGEVNYLSAFDGKIWHIFSSAFVIDVLDKMEIVNSVARHSGQIDAQKVLIKSKVNIGEIEIRTDSEQHYREVKFRIDGQGRLLPLLIKEAGMHKEYDGKAIVKYEKARKTFKRSESIVRE